MPSFSNTHQIKNMCRLYQMSNTKMAQRRNKANNSELGPQKQKPEGRKGKRKNNSRATL